MGRRSKAVKLVGGVRGGLALLDDDERRRVIEAGERDIDDGVGFFRGTARPGTALMVAYVDEFRDRFRAGIGRGLVTSVMREPGIRGARRWTYTLRRIWPHPTISPACPAASCFYAMRRRRGAGLSIQSMSRSILAAMEPAPSSVIMRPKVVIVVSSLLELLFW